MEQEKNSQIRIKQTDKQKTNKQQNQRTKQFKLKALVKKEKLQTKEWKL